MSSQKNNTLEVVSNNEVPEMLEDIDNNVIKKYQELNNKCDVIITKIKIRKSKKIIKDI